MLEIFNVKLTKIKRIGGKMDRKTYRICRGVNGALIALALGFFVPNGNYLGVAVAFTIGLAVSHLCRRRVTEVVEDERVRKVEGEAAKKTLVFGLIGMAIGGVLLVTLSNGGYFELREVGLTLIYSDCVLVIIFIGLSWLYRKHIR